MRIVTFIAKQHEEFGTIGLQMKGRRWADPLGGMAVAHDLLEHFPKDDGSCEHELMALGASYYVRNGSAYYCARGQYQTDPAMNISADMVQQCYFMDRDGRTALRPIMTRPCRNEEFEDFARRTFIESVRLCRSELDDPAMTRWIRSEPFIGWLRAGYRRARIRYNRVQEWRTCHAFEQIEKAADRVIDREVDFPGQEFNIAFDVRSGDVRIEHVQDPYGY
jgi:hypothetical protein